jgi:hypothetical protein
VDSHAGISAFSGPALTHGFQIAFYILAATAAAGGALAALLIESQPAQAEREPEGGELQVAVVSQHAPVCRTRRVFMPRPLPEEATNFKPILRLAVPKPVPYLSTLDEMQRGTKGKAPRLRGLCGSPLPDSNRRPPPYHAIQTATGGSRWQRFGAR